MFKFLSKAAGVFGYVVQYGCLTHCTFEYLGDFVVCVGPSMEPTLHTNNILITDHITPRLNHLQRGDIIIAKSPTNPLQHVCKRIVGLPGDRIMTKASFNLNPLSNSYTIHTSVVPGRNSDSAAADQKLRQKVDFVSGSVDASSDDGGVELVEEHPAHPEIRTSIVTVPRGHLWIEGDNVQNSSDSRNYGPVPIGLVKSKAICRIWPVTQFQVFA
ncbi:mitochondrial inner membrane protease subunit [Culex quinquefasciatus]|uniref:Mitochondrial inner membrane protease subunit n=1 Tax=Culex quinquefasciatus TaxID=7176 RepID=B0W2D0_CULQU|nr:mitochondrial inner membrane protease subunit 1 [Culex quinquefasciatus]EDS28676.1 mitochondrial inner membrane protease subunit [Culex quinquefasciatus]|eukprot:XP_001842833.1 mitochondrial inner membrane protease subunit [Culex quinquefasciatus]